MDITKFSTHGRDELLQAIQNYADSWKAGTERVMSHPAFTQLYIALDSYEQAVIDNYVAKHPWPKLPELGEEVFVCENVGQAMAPQKIIEHTFKHNKPCFYTDNDWGPYFADEEGTYWKRKP